jgi:hypothetical protein
MMTTKPRKSATKKAKQKATRYQEFRVRDLLVTQVPAWMGSGLPAGSCDCDSSCSAVTGHPVHTDYCGYEGFDIFVDPPDIKDLQGLVRKMKPMTKTQLKVLEKSLTGALNAVRGQMKMG